MHERLDDYTGGRIPAYKPVLLSTSFGGVPTELAAEKVRDTRPNHPHPDLRRKHNRQPNSKRRETLWHVRGSGNATNLLEKLAPVKREICIIIQIVLYALNR